MVRDGARAPPHHEGKTAKNNWRKHRNADQVRRADGAEKSRPEICLYRSRGDSVLRSERLLTMRGRRPRITGGNTAMPIKYDELMALKSLGQKYAYTDREVMLYAYGIGMGADPMDEKELAFVNEAVASPRALKEIGRASCRERV